MARISPTLDNIRYDAGFFREIDVLEKLQDSLPDGYEIFHSAASPPLPLEADPGADTAPPVNVKAGGVLSTPVTTRFR